jgi:hypothetical protein
MISRPYYALESQACRGSMPIPPIPNDRENLSKSTFHVGYSIDAYFAVPFHSPSEIEER